MWLPSVQPANLNRLSSFETWGGVPLLSLALWPQSPEWVPCCQGAAGPSPEQLSLQVLKVAILAEKYAVDYTWYVDTILNLIRIAGDYVSEEVWYRVIQIVINRDDVQGYAAKTVFEVPAGPRELGPASCLCRAQLLSC